MPENNNTIIVSTPIVPILTSLEPLRFRRWINSFRTFHQHFLLTHLDPPPSMLACVSMEIQIALDSMINASKPMLDRFLESITVEPATGRLLEQKVSDKELMVALLGKNRKIHDPNPIEAMLFEESLQIDTPVKIKSPRNRFRVSSRSVISQCSIRLCLITGISTHHSQI